MTTVRYVKDPHAELDYKVNWSDWLASGETISVATWTVPSGITKTNSSLTSSAATIWLSGGTTGTVYTLTVSIQTDSSPARYDDRSFKISIEDR